MNFDNIAETQEFEGNTVDVIFNKKRQSRRKNSTKTAEIDLSLKKHITFDSQSPPDLTATQKTDSQDDQFRFTNENIFLKKMPTSAMFRKYFPAQVLNFTEAELAEINELFVSLQERQAAGSQQNQLTQANVGVLDSSCLLERFLKETEAVVPNMIDGSQTSSFLFDSSSPVS